MNYSDSVLGLILNDFGLNQSTVDTIYDQGEARITIAVLQSQLDVSISLRIVAEI